MSSSLVGSKLNWFPGHMARATRQLAEKLGKCDGVVEVRDARLPFSTANPDLRTLAAPLPRIVLLNKADLANPSLQHRVIEAVKEEEGDGVEVIFHSASTGVKGRRRRSMRRLWGLLRDTAELASSVRGFESTGAMFFVIGVPNVGKSTVLNGLREEAGWVGKKRKKKGAKVGGVPGVTRQVNAIAVCRDPPVYVSDSPGITQPKIDDVATGMRLGICGCLPAKVVDDLDLAISLLEHLAHLQPDDCPISLREKPVIPYEHLQSSPLHALETFGKAMGVLGKGGVVDENAAATKLIAAFRNGHLGRFTLDPIPSK